MNYALFFKPHTLGPPLHDGALQNVLPFTLYMRVTGSSLLFI